MTYAERSRTYLFVLIMLISRFHRCSVNVKLTLFKTFGLCVHDTALWKYFVPLLTVNLSLHIINAWRKCLATRGAIVWLDLSLHTLGTVVHNSCVLFANQSLRSCNKIVQWFLSVCVLCSYGPVSVINLDFIGLIDWLYGLFFYCLLIDWCLLLLF